MARSVLLVEDDQNDILLFSHALRHAGGEVRLMIARDGADAIACLSRQGRFADPRMFPEPELIFLDLKTPRIDGFEVLEWLRQHPELCHVPAVVLTGSHHMRDVTHAYELGATGFLQKPPTSEQLQELLAGIRITQRLSIG